MVFSKRRIITILVAICFVLAPAYFISVPIMEINPLLFSFLGGAFAIITLVIAIANFPGEKEMSEKWWKISIFLLVAVCIVTSYFAYDGFDKRKHKFINENPVVVTGIISNVYSKPWGKGHLGYGMTVKFKDLDGAQHSKEVVLSFTQYQNMNTDTALTVTYEKNHPSIFIINGYDDF